VEWGRIIALNSNLVWVSNTVRCLGSELALWGCWDIFFIQCLCVLLYFGVLVFAELSIWRLSNTFIFWSCCPSVLKIVSNKFSADFLTSALLFCACGVAISITFNVSVSFSVIIHASMLSTSSCRDALSSSFPKCFWKMVSTAGRLAGSSVTHSLPCLSSHNVQQWMYNNS